MLEDEWICVSHDSLINGRLVDERVRPAPGKRQYVSRNVGSHAEEGEEEGTPQMMLAADMVLLWDDGFRTHLGDFAEDEELLKKEFGAAYKKLTELGTEGELLEACPFSTTPPPDSDRWLSWDFR